MKITLNQILVLSATLITIGINAAANILPINGLTTAVISDSFYTYFVPAGYVFSIWGVIYLLLLGFAFAFGVLVEKKGKYFDQIVPWYLLSSVANIVWIFSWHYEYFATTSVAMVALLISLLAIHKILDANEPKSYLESWLGHVPFYVYTAWISVATIANVSNVLWFYGFTGFGLPGQYWAAIMIIVAGALTGMVTLLTRNMAFAIVVAWAVIGIMVKFQAETPILLAGVLTLVFMAGTLTYKKFMAKS